MLIKSEITSTEFQGVFMITIGESESGIGREVWFKDNLSGSTAEVHDGDGAVRGGSSSSDLAKEVIGRDPSVYSCRDVSKMSTSTITWIPA